MEKTHGIMDYDFMTSDWTFFFYGTYDECEKKKDELQKDFPNDRMKVSPLGCSIFS